MTRHFPQELIEEIKARVSIREVVAEYLTLTKDGANYKALCPFHREKTPSFKVHEAKGIFHCFGCGESGNIFTFLMKKEGISFPEAVERLARRAGVELPKELKLETSKEDEEKAILFRVNELAQKFYQKELFSPENKKALDYLQSRGLTRDDIEGLSLGYAPPGWENLLRYLGGRGISPLLALNAGLIIPREAGEGYYDRFRDRVVFPIKDLLGRVCGFGARALDDSLPKYINSPETDIYKKGEMLYGLPDAKESIRKKDRVIIVEGYFDRITLDLFGFKETLASLGTAFTESQARIVGRYTRNVYLVFDPDEAGRKASFRALNVFLATGLIPFLVLMPEGYDPDDLVRKLGAEHLEKLLQNAPRLLDYFLEEKLSSAGSDLSRKSEVIRELIRTIALIPMALERELYLKKLSELSGVSLNRLERTILRERVKEKGGESEADEKFVINWLGSQELLLACLVNNPTQKLANLFKEQNLFEKVNDSILSQYLSSLCEEIIEKGKADPSDYFHLLTNSKWERIAGRALAEKCPYQGDQIFQVVKDAIEDMEKRRMEDLNEELTRRLNLAKKEGNDQLVLELLAEKDRLIKLKREQGLGRSG